ncbi:hypothetical protein N7495_007443 [Penicillium taxi]|uniref:uncharacterized protein n=1 Tax=Penicillium taxi TaxID=168475 RepID=UPI0025452A5F|nr:uncharacterized protein N7495_007443 [Penicillium taxi]KAJ5887402.1 hypothetical protein N7495_007443 [Penicillium taxi]
MDLVPSDVLLIIGEHLDHHADRWNLIFVSQLFHNLFLPLLYRTAQLHNWQSIKSFFYALTNKPVLIHAVRQLDLSGWQSQCITNSEREELKTAAALIECIKSSSHSAEEATQWEVDLGKGHVDAWIALLLPMLSQLRQLHLAYATHTPCLDRIMHRAISGERPFQPSCAFQKLQEVSLYHRDEIEYSRDNHADINSRSPSTALLLSFFQLPSMRAICAKYVVDQNAGTENPNISLSESEDQNTKHIQSFQPGSSTITDIDLRSSSGNHGMKTLVASCTGLRSFKYQHSDSNLISRGYQPTAFYRSLARSKGTLQTLWLDHYGDHYPFTAAGLNQSHDEWFGSLADFTALREVRIRLPNLLDIQYRNDPTTPLLNCLPSSLETLYIEGCEERQVPMLASQLQAVIENRCTRMPRLQRVEIEGGFRNTSSDEYADTTNPATFDNTIKSKIMQAVEPLHVHCIAAGVELHLYDRAFHNF